MNTNDLLRAHAQIIKTQTEMTQTESIILAVVEQADEIAALRARVETLRCRVLENRCRHLDPP